jgi:hypothetical protein
MAVRLMNQSEAKRPTASGHWLGSEIFYTEDEDFYTIRFHARTYDGIKVTSSYTTGEIRLAGQGGFLKSEVKRLFHQFASLYITEPDLDAVRESRKDEG